ncbi:MAG: glutathione peroxidase [Phycisphaerales bacterium JB039]
MNREAYSQGPVHQFTVEGIDGASISLDQYRGQPMLIVNVASECGLTPQYEQLEALYRSYRDKGLVVLGFPANNFGGQEPGTDAQIKAFCQENYDISFPMFSKVSVVGADQSALFAELSKTGGPPTWNFTKYLVGPDGRVVARFDPRTSPQAEEITQQIDALLSS